MADVGITYSLKFQARALAAQSADKINSKWIVGTNALREDNEVRVLQYDADQERLLSVRSFHHPPEIWCIAPSGASEDVFLTVWSKEGTYGVSLWRAQPDGTLLQEANLPGHTSTIRSVAWHAQHTEVALTVEESGIRSWAISDQGVQSTGHVDSGELLQLWSGALHPGNPNTAVTAGGQNVQLWDLRSMSMTAQTQGAHRMPTRDVSFAPHNEHRIVSSGDDCKLRFWDTRILAKAEPLLELGGHSHWVWRTQYNPFYDQLVASSSSDCLVQLYHLPQLAAATGSTSTGGSPESSSASATRGATPGRAGDIDGKAHTFDEHEDSVYGLAWSMVDPWLFATLSYDGRVVLNVVPKNIKYKVLI